MLGLVGPEKLVPMEVDVGLRGCFSHKAWPQLLPRPRTNNPKLKTAQAKQQEWAGQGAGSHPLLAVQPLLRAAGLGTLDLQWATWGCSIQVYAAQG